MSRERRKLRTGRVVSDKMDKTIIVAVQWRQRDRLYKKPQRRITKFYAEDSNNSCSLGDLVRIEETRPISRLKSWRLIDIIERREVAEVKPVDLDQAFMESQMRGQDSEAKAPDEIVADQAVEEIESTTAEDEAVEVEPIVAKLAEAVEEPVVAELAEDGPVEAEPVVAELAEDEPELKKESGK